MSGSIFKEKEPGMEPQRVADDSGTAFISQPSTLTTTTSTRSKDEKGCCCGCCTWKKACFTFWIVVIIVVLVVIGLYFGAKSKLTGEATSEDSEAWEESLSTSGDPSGGQLGPTALINGQYKLVSYDENYETYLKSVGIPFFLVPLILSSSETLYITASDDPHGEWSIVNENDMMTREMRFRLGEEFSMEWGRGSGVMHNVCTLLTGTETVMRCTSEERAKGWHFDSQMKFSAGGIINERYFIDKGVRAKKYFQRTTPLPTNGEVDQSPVQSDIRDEAEDEETLIEAVDNDGLSEEENPFGGGEQQDDDDFWNSEWD